MSRGGARAVEVVTVVAVVLLGTAPLLVLLLDAATDGTVFTGADGPFAGDQFQYFAWIREYADSFLARNDLDLAPSDRVFLHPMFLPSGLLVRLGVDVPVAFLLWKPVAIVALLAGALAYARRFATAPWERAVAFALALLFASPMVVLLGDEVLGATGAAFPASLLWGYLPAAISVGLMPVFLLGLERLERGRTVVAVAVCGAIVSWLHPWQGQVLLVTVVAAAALLRRRDLPYGRMAIACAATLAPLLYYFVLSLTDASWELAAEANESLGHLPLWSVLVALLPLAVVAAAGVRRPRDLGEAMLLAWPAATVLTFALLSPSFPQHALAGVSIPLGVLAAQGLARLAAADAAAPLRSAAAPLAGAFVLLMIVPGTAYMVDWFRDTVRAGGQAHHLERGEADALEHLDELAERGGVLTSARLGTLVPSATGRASWVGHPSWTRDYHDRVRAVDDLLAGDMEPERAAALVRDSGARFVLVECGRPAEAARAIARLASRSRSFGCASVHAVRR